MQLFSSSLPQWLVASRVRGISCTENLGTYGGSFPPMSKARRLIMRVASPHRGKGPGAEAPLDQAMDNQMSWLSGTRLSPAIKTHSADIKGSTAVHIWPASAPLGRGNNICNLMTGPSFVRQASRAPQQAYSNFDFGLRSLALSENVRLL